MFQGHWFRKSLLAFALACAPPLAERGLTATGLPAPPTPLAATEPASEKPAVPASLGPIAPAAAATLTGRVFDVADGRPIAGAAVELVRVANPDPQSWSLGSWFETGAPMVVAHGSAAAATSSDTTGSFQVRSASGAYHVRASADGYPSLLGPAVRLQAGRPVPFLEVPLRAKGTLVVQMLDQEGKPISDVSMNVSGEEDGWRSVISCVADVSGRCAIDVPSHIAWTLRTQVGVEPTRKRQVPEVDAGARRNVEVKLEPLNRITGRVVDIHGRPFPGARIELRGFSSPDDFTPKAVAGASGEFEIAAPEFVFQLSAASLGYCMVNTPPREPFAPIEIKLDRCATISGRVLDASSGKPLAGATVRADRARGVTDAEGAYALTVENLGKQPRLSAYLFGHDRAAAEPASLRQGEHRMGVDIPMQASTAGGRVRGVVRDIQTGAPVAGAEIEVGLSRGWRTSEDGRFDVDAPDGKSWLSVEAEGRADWKHQLELRGETLDVTVQMLPETVVRGRIADAEGNPVKFARVRLYDLVENRCVGTGSTDETGAYTVPDVPGDRVVRVAASHRELGETALDGVRVQVGEKRSGIDLVFGPSTILSGMVVDESGRPFKRVSVSASFRRMDDDCWPFGSRENRHAYAATGPDGKFELEPLAPGAYTLKAETDDGRFAVEITVHLPLRPGQAPVVLRLVSGVLIRGRAMHPDGSPVRSVLLQVVSNSRERSRVDISSSDSNGVFLLGPMLPGAYRLEATYSDRRWRQDLDVQAPADDLEVIVPLDAGVRGRVVRAADGRPVQNFRILTRFKTETDESRGRRFSSFSSVDGTFALENVPAGPITLEITAPGLAPGRTDTLRLDAGNTLAGVEIRLGAAGSIAGVVRDAQGKPVAGAEVTAKTSDRDGPVPSANRFSSGTLTGAGGEFLFAELPGGRLDLVARDPARGEVKLSLKVIPGEARQGIELRLVPP